MAAIAQFPDPPTLGPASQHCSTCGALLAADQRYCLNCGTRRAESRVPFPESLAGTNETAGTAPAPAAAPAAAAGAPAAAAAKPKRSWADRDLLLPVLGTALLAIAVGILIGRSGASDTINTKAPVVNVAPTAGTAAAPADATANAADTGTSGSTASKSSSASKTKSTASADKAAPPANVSKSTLQDNANASGKDYVNKSKKLPTQVSTGGKPLPKDNKPAGGGTDGGTTIG